MRAGCGPTLNLPSGSLVSSPPPPPHYCVFKKSKIISRGGICFCFFSSRLKRAAASQHFRAGRAHSGGSPGSSLLHPGGCSRDSHPGPRDTRAKAGRCWCRLVCGGCCAMPLARRDPLCQPAAGGRGKAGVPLGLRSCSRPFFALCFLAKFQACRAAASLQPPCRGYFHLGGSVSPAARLLWLGKGDALEICLCRLAVNFRFALTPSRGENRRPTAC